MTPYVDRDPSGDLTIRDADTNKAICYMPSCGAASGLKAAERKRIERMAERIVEALSKENT